MKDCIHLHYNCFLLLRLFGNILFPRFKFDYSNEKRLKSVLQEHIVRDITINTEVEHQLQQVFVLTTIILSKITTHYQILHPLLCLSCLQRTRPWFSFTHGN